MNKTKLARVGIVVLVVVLCVAAYAVFHGLIGNPFHIPAKNYQAAYRLVPEKVSLSAAISVSLPTGTSMQNFDPTKQVMFDPKIEGRWIDGKVASIIPSAHAAEAEPVYYFQPNKTLALNKHYSVTLALSEGKTMQSDFLVVPDPAVISILPHDGEVVTDTKISIVFNRPMVPLSTIDEMSPTDPPVSISPNTAGRFKWISTNTLQFISDSGLIGSAKYTVSVKAGLKSLEGLDVKPFTASFTTRHLRFWTDPSSYSDSKATTAVRGYNQPFLIRFNQAVDLDRTKNSVTVNDGEKNIPFSVQEGKIDGPLDPSIMAIYPAGGDSGVWQLHRTYTVTVTHAYPASHGDISLDAPGTFYFSVDNIYSSLTVLSPRTSDASLDRFDPQGQLAMHFYEDIDLAKSKITGPAVNSVVYGEKCKDDVNTSKCTKVPDQSLLLVSFDADKLKTGDTTEVDLDSIASASGNSLSSTRTPISLSVYGPLAIFDVKSGDSLNTLTICSNNPLQTDSAKQKIDSTPVVKPLSWSHSYRSDVNHYGTISPCAVGQFITSVSGYLLPQAGYQGKIEAADVFGGSASKAFDFSTRDATDNDYELHNYQSTDIVAVPGKTKMTFAETFLPRITSTVCRLSPYDYYRVRQDYKLDARDYCQETVSKTIELPTDQPGRVFFGVDIADYFPDQIGNYAVLLSSPLLAVNRNNSWRYSTVSYISVTNLVVTQKSINPSLTAGYNGAILRGDQINKLQNMYWVIDARTQGPVAGASVKTYKDGSVVETATTNDQGLAYLVPIADPEMTVVSLGGDNAVMAGGATVLNYAESASNAQKTFLYTDKPIYRPGQEVDIKGLLRAGYDGYYEAPSATPMTLTVTDPSNAAVKQVQLTPNGFGSISTILDLDPSAKLGTYSACIKYQCAYFDVLDYAPAAFKVDMTTAKDEYNKGDDPAIQVSSNYYFGIPVSNVALNYHVSSQYYYFDKYTKEYLNFNNLSDDMGQGYYYGDRYISSGQATLDQNGQTTIKPTGSVFSGTGQDQSKIVVIDSTVKNQEGRSISAQKSFIMHAAPIYIGSKIVEPFIGKGEAISLKLKTVDTAANPRSLGVKVNLYHVYWTSTKNGNGNMIWDQKRDLVKAIDASTDSNGDGSLALPQVDEGEYAVDVTSGQDGAAVGSRSWFYVYGDQNVSVRGSDDTSLEMVLNDTTVKSGTTAEVLIKMPEGKGKALVTIERGSIYSYKIIDLTGSLTRFQFPVEQRYYPNVYVSVVAYAPNRAVRFGSQNIKVDSDQKKLDLTISPDKQQYSPGDKVTLNIRSTDSSGKPVIADVSLAVVEMNVLALRGNPHKDPLQYFYGNIPLTIGTASNYKSLLKDIPWQSSDGKGGGGGDLDKQKSRGNFKEVAYWNADIMTDQGGNAVLSFVLPDNLTTWQAEAVGITQDTSLGVAYKEFISSKELMIVPLEPRFVLPGDKFSLGATIFNNSRNDFKGSVALTVPSTLDSSKASLKSDMSLKAGESKDVYFDLSVPETAQPGDIPYTIEASGSGLSDSVVDTIKVNPSSAYEVTATAGQTDSSASESIYVPTTIIPNMGELSVRSSATLAMYLPQALNYMIDYPYDCTEQMGSQIQAIALMDKAHLLFTNGTSTYTGKILFDGKEQKAQDIIQSRLQSIYNRQSSDGGFRLWSESYSSSLFATEEALKAFDTLKSAGYSIDETAWDKGADYLYSQYSHSNIVYSDEEIIAFAEALYTRPRYVSDLSFAKDFNSAVDRILKNETVSTGTLLSISGLSHRYGFLASQSKKIDLTLENRVIVDSRGSFLDASSGGYRYETAISNTARYIELLSMEKQNQAELPNLLRWLTLSRSKDGSWDSTENNLAVIKGFTQYLDWQPETSAVFMETNSLNGETIDTFSYKPENILTTISKTLPMSRLQFGGMNTVAFARSADGAASKGKIYYDLSLKYYLPADTMGPRDEGFAISHGFYALSDTKGQTPINQAHVGDVLREHIEFTVPVTRNDVSIEDFIPAGMEIVDTSLATEDKTLSNDVVRSAYEDQDISNSEQDVQDSTFWPDHQEWKDDRAFLYKESLSPGTYSFDYKVRALVPGKYLRLPSQISELYTPENFGRTGAGSFTIDK